jgi:hypothetical protein
MALVAHLQVDLESSAVAPVVGDKSDGPEVVATDADVHPNPADIQAGRDNKSDDC